MDSRLTIVERRDPSLHPRDRVGDQSRLGSHCGGDRDMYQSSSGKKCSQDVFLGLQGVKGP